MLKCFQPHKQRQRKEEYPHGICRRESGLVGADAEDGGEHGLGAAHRMLFLYSSGCAGGARYSDRVSMGSCAFPYLIRSALRGADE